MRKFILGLITGVVLTATTSVFAASTMKANFTFNGVGKELPQEYTVLNHNGRIYVPVRFVAEGMGASVNWNSQTNTVEVKNPAYTVEDALNELGYYPLPPGYVLTSAARVQALELVKIRSGK